MARDPHPVDSMLSEAPSGSLAGRLAERGYNTKGKRVEEVDLRDLSVCVEVAVVLERLADSIHDGAELWSDDDEALLRSLAARLRVAPR